MIETKINRPMTLDDAITHCLQKAQACTACGEEHRQLAAWLSELKKIREEKSEADKAIAEKDAEIARLKAIRKVHVEAIESMGAGLLQDEEENRHSKYKRCLAMANVCAEKLYRRDLTIYGYKFYCKWIRRWLTLANKYKEGNV